MNVCIPLSVGKTHSIAFDLYHARLCILQILILQFAIEIAFRHSFMSVVVMKLFVLPDFHAKVANEKLARNLHLLD